MFIRNCFYFYRKHLNYNSNWKCEKDSNNLIPGEMVLRMILLYSQELCSVQNVLILYKSAFRRSGSLVKVLFCCLMAFCQMCLMGRQ